MRGRKRTIRDPRSVAVRRANLLFVLLLLVVGFGSAARGQTRSLVGVVSEVDLVGKAIEVLTPPSWMNPRRESFLVVETTVILVHGRAGSLADLSPGEEVTVSYFPARVPHAAQRIELR